MRHADRNSSLLKLAPTIVELCLNSSDRFGVGALCPEWELYALKDPATKIGLFLQRSVETKQTITR